MSLNMRIKTRFGFSLIEMMVAVSVFSVIMLISATSILAIVNANRKAQALKSVINNLTFAMETMTRNIRVGTNFRCMGSETVGVLPGNIDQPSNCNSGAVLAFVPQLGDPNDKANYLVYRFCQEAAGQHACGQVQGKGALWRQIGTGPLDPLEPTPKQVRLTAPEVDIDKFEFQVVGEEANPPRIQPHVRIYMKGTVEMRGAKTDFELQTAVTQRELDL